MRISDWSSDVCSSDLQLAAWVAFYLLVLIVFSILPALLESPVAQPGTGPEAPLAEVLALVRGLVFVGVVALGLSALVRSEERRVGKAGVSTCSSRWSPYH